MDSQVFNRVLNTLKIYKIGTSVGIGMVPEQGR